LKRAAEQLENLESEAVGVQDRPTSIALSVRKHEQAFSPTSRTRLGDTNRAARDSAFQDRCA